MKRLKKYLKQRKINKTRMKIAGLKERQRLLYIVTKGDHMCYDRQDLFRTSQLLAVKEILLDVLTYEEPIK